MIFFEIVFKLIDLWYLILQDLQSFSKLHFKIENKIIKLDKHERQLAAKILPGTHSCNLTG